MKIQQVSDVWFMAIKLTLLSCLIVTPAIMLAYPQERWPYELTVSLALTVVITLCFAGFVGAKMLENQRLSEELQRLVDRDRLTDVATRDFFFAAMSREPDSYGVSLMVDIDNFKNINDGYGHLAGDAVIHAVAQILRKTVRKGDIVCRFGGEEFVIFLHGADEKSGFALAERMRERVESETVPFDIEKISVTVSIGGSLKRQIDALTQSIQEADEALYRAKQTGRNRTVFADKEVVAT